MVLKTRRRLIGVSAVLVALTAGGMVGRRFLAEAAGGKGRGGRPGGGIFNPAPRGFSLAAISGQTDGSLFWKLSEGRKPMPAFKDLTTESERWQIINFVRLLAPPAAATK